MLHPNVKCPVQNFRGHRETRALPVRKSAFPEEESHACVTTSQAPTPASHALRRFSQGNGVRERSRFRLEVQRPREPTRSHRTPPVPAPPGNPTRAPADPPRVGTAAPLTMARIPSSPALLTAPSSRSQRKARDTLELPSDSQSNLRMADRKFPPPLSCLETLIG